MTRPTYLSLSLIAVFALASCSALPSLPSFGSDKAAQEAEDKAGRIAMVLEDEILEADPELLTESIALPPAEVNASWSQTGKGSSKVSGHVQAGDAFEIAWRVNAGKGTDKKSAIAAPPVTDASNVYVVDASQTVRAFSLETGGRVWEQALKSGQRRDKVGNGAGIALEDGKLVVASGFGFIAALDAATGSEIWRTNMSAPMTGSPTIKNGLVFATSNNNEIFAINFETGEVEWSDQAISETARVLGSPSPAAVEELVVAPFSSGEVIAYLATNGRRLWTEALSRSGRFTPISAINDVSSRPVLSAGIVYAASQSGLLTGIDGRSGNRVWVQPVGTVQAPAVVGGYMFIASTDAQVVALQAPTGKVFWVTQLEEYEKAEKRKNKITYSGPLIASNRVPGPLIASNRVLVASSRGELISLDPQTGTEIGRLNLKSPVFIEPIAAGGKVLVLSDEGTLIAIR